MAEVSVFDGTRPTHPGDLVTEVHGIAPIPTDGRYGSARRSFTVWFGPNMQLSAVFTGTLAYTLGLGFWPGLVALVLGVTLGAVPVAVLTLWGPRTGMGQLPLARLPFGKSITLPALVQWLSAVAWDGLVGLFGGEAAQLLFHVPFALGVVVVLAAEGLVGFLGYEFIHQLESWGSIVLAVLFVFLTYRVFRHGNLPMHNTVHGATAVGTFVLVTTIAFSGSFSWASYAADYSRYMAADTPRGPLFWATFGGLVGSFVWVYTLGLAGAKALGSQTAAGVRDLMGRGVAGELALVAIVFGAIAGNAMNDYSGSLAMQAGGVKIKRPYSAGIGTVLAFFLILWIHGGNTAGKFENVLLFTAYWIAPFLAVILIDWHDRRGTVTRQSLLDSLDFRKLGSGWPALVALVVGFGAMVPFMDTSIVVGPVAKALDGADISFYVGFVVAALVYLPLRRLAVRPVGLAVPPAPEAPAPTTSAAAPVA